MTVDALETLVEQYRAGLEAEMVLLHRLEQLAKRQQDATERAALDDLPVLLDERDRVMASLVSIEHEIKPIRLKLHAHQDQLAGLRLFATVAARHEEAAALITAIVATDRDSMVALKAAERSRRFAARIVEQSESTLAAYRRVLVPPLANATLVNRKG